ncbi:MAG: class I SAM-dependent methyltransferase [Pseudomonadales bacterium]|nr:class I SAM-dependent methyltransferase [Pseudomonadales bacterium]
MHIDVYRDPGVVDAYRNLDYLEPAEEWLLREYESSLPQMRMLDVAVGCGRTTRYFADRVQSYLGVDFSPGMIEVCRERFAETDRLRFEVADMSDMSGVTSESFDLVLVSYNAMSALDHAARQRAFREFARVMRAGGTLLFSNFNIPYVPISFGLWTAFRKATLSNPKTYYWRLKKWVRINYLLNDHRLVKDVSKLGHVELIDGYHDYRLKHYYVRGSEQIAQLERDFENIRVFARGGEELLTPAAWDNATDEWLFYFATKRR